MSHRGYYVLEVFYLGGIMTSYRAKMKTSL